MGRRKMACVGRGGSSANAAGEQEDSRAVLMRSVTGLTGDSVKRHLERSGHGPRYMQGLAAVTPAAMSFWSSDED